MIGIRKPFNKNLYQQNDPKSRKVIIEYFKKQGIDLIENPDRYGVDLVSPDKTLWIEIERRPVWDGEEFPFAEINVPERKAKFLAAGKSQYIILSKDFSHIGIIDAKAIMPYIVDTNLVMNSNRFVRDGEYFYKIPSSAFRWIKV